MILSDGEINLLVREASRNSAINRDGTTSQRIARAIEAKVLEKLSDKLRDAERKPDYTEAWNVLVERGVENVDIYDVIAAIDAAIKESK